MWRALMFAWHTQGWLVTVACAAERYLHGRLRLLPRSLVVSGNWADPVLSGNSAGADSARIPCSDGADGRFATADFGRVGRPVVVNDVDNQPVTKQQGRQAARR